MASESSSSSGMSQLEEVIESIDSVIAESGEKSQKKAADSSGVSTVVEATSKLAINDLSNDQLVHYLQSQEDQKKREKYEKYLKKMYAVNDKEHKFWNTQPVPNLNDTVSEFGPIDPNVDVTTVRQEPYNMPAGFEWSDIDVNDPAQLLELYNLLTENYVEDDDCQFRFDYSVEFLKWALTPPGFMPQLHVGVRSSKTKNLMGCITGIPSDIQVYGSVIPMVEINFLCVHKKLRTKRLAPVLIKEVTRRVNLTGRWQATYTAGIVLPKPVGRCRYYHRSLNPKKLIEVRFSAVPPRSTLAKHIKELKLPDKPFHPFRPMEPRDVAGVHALLTESLRRQKLSQVFSVEELSHVLSPLRSVVSTYVLENGGNVTDFCSFYHLPSSILKHDKHKTLFAVYSYYNVATTISFLELMTDSLILARNEGADVFNALDLADNATIFSQLKFGQGDGYLQYYLYNWKCPPIEAREVGLVLL